MKKTVSLLLVLLATLSLGACHKSCVCVKYDLTEHHYTPEEVDAAGGSCTHMRNPYGGTEYYTQYYAYCEWE